MMRHSQRHEAGEHHAVDEAARQRGGGESEDRLFGRSRQATVGPAGAPAAQPDQFVARRHGRFEQAHFLPPIAPQIYQHRAQRRRRYRDQRAARQVGDERLAITEQGLVQPEEPDGRKP